MKHFAILLLCTLSVINLRAQNDGEITGKVVAFDSTKNKLEPVPLAHIIVYLNDAIVMHGESDFNGVYLLKPLAPNTYDLEVIAGAFDTLKMTGIVVGSDAMVYQDLKVSTATDLPVFVFKAPLVNRTNPQVEDKITGVELRQQGNDDIQSAIAKNTPTVLQNDKTGGLYINGSREDATLYVIDGVRVIGSTYLPMNAIREINVITGGIPANYGDFMGGVVEILTKSSGVY